MRKRKKGQRRLPDIGNGTRKGRGGNSSGGRLVEKFVTNKPRLKGGKKGKKRKETAATKEMGTIQRKMRSCKQGRSRSRENNGKK